MKVVLKRGREKSVKNGHPWIFSGAIESAPADASGDILEVVSSQNEFLGWGYFNSKSKIFGRIVSYKSCDPVDEIKRQIANAYPEDVLEKKQRLFAP